MNSEITISYSGSGKLFEWEKVREIINLNNLDRTIEKVFPIFLIFKEQTIRVKINQYLEIKFFLLFFKFIKENMKKKKGWGVKKKTFYRNCTFAINFLYIAGT